MLSSCVTEPCPRRQSQQDLDINSAVVVEVRERSAVNSKHRCQASYNPSYARYVSLSNVHLQLFYELAVNGPYHASSWPRKTCFRQFLFPWPYIRHQLENGF